VSGAPGALRRSLWPLAAVYGLGVWMRNALFDAGVRRVHRLPVPVVSVGNLTVGGTGKTPFVAWLVERARARGRRPGVLARGYRRAAGAELNDEGLLLAGRFPDLPQVQDPDRVRGGRALVARGVDLIVLDDGFQHRRLHRDRDLVCLDAERPFAGGLLLPAGNLREPRAALRRASAVVLTRAGAIAPPALAGLGARLRELAGERLAVFAAEHRPSDVRWRPADRVEPAAALAGRAVLLLSAIARPQTFAATVHDLGARVVAHVARRDHHAWEARELEQAASRARAQGAVLLVTEKDDVKLPPSLERGVLRIDFAFLGDTPDDATLGIAPP
jgi:tetraacyldisaccharide 4'-kinase